ncbi:hypothetical protein [Novosphingobium sp. JCM 18896]|uniref:hypothetical protein n=1 Tax=Novosphingobium sp. JCM 18896 TaxID=2989731 RepID=UPI00222175F6|nr:hypothetical protein [Novosphingobium sp. JCM 18896]MCW1429589.1 hypothetical protein [Novosphingobium sp. JCM 18896]
MPIGPIAENKSANRLAFDHYLRTGQRLTTAQWLERVERKFNPYHDELGRFTSAPGVTVSWGASAAARHSQSSERSRAGRRPMQAGPRLPASGSPSHQNGSTPSAPGRVDAGFGSEFVRDRTSQAGNADTYFELNKRQAGLNRLREAAGANPSAAVRADLDDFQARLDANRVLLNHRSKVADKEIVKAFRKVNPVIDVGAATVNVIQGDADLDDAISLASNVPILGAGKFVAGAVVGGVVRGARIAKPFATSKVTKDTVLKVVDGVVQRGGAHRHVRGVAGYESHHIPGDAVTSLSRGDGPTIAMTKEDHRKILTSLKTKEADQFRAAQRDLIAKGDFRAAMQMDIDLVRKEFGSRYDDGIEQMLQYSRERGLIK